MEPRLQQLIDDVKQYAGTRYDLLRLQVLEKLSLIIGLLILVLIGAFLILIAFTYFSVALVMWLSNYMTVSIALMIIGALFLIVMAVLVIFRKRLFINPLVEQLSKILFSPATEQQPSQQQSITTNTEERE